MSIEINQHFVLKSTNSRTLSTKGRHFEKKSQHASRFTTYNDSVHPLLNLLYASTQSTRFYSKLTCCKKVDVFKSHTCQRTMGWLRLVGSLKVKVTFAKEPYKRDDILQKRPVILRSLLMIATPYM